MNEDVTDQEIDCNCEDEDVIMDKLASISYIAMMSLVAYGMLALSALTIA